MSPDTYGFRITVSYPEINIRYAAVERSWICIINVGFILDESSGEPEHIFQIIPVKATRLISKDKLRTSVPIADNTYGVRHIYRPGDQIFTFRNKKCPERFFHFESVYSLLQGKADIMFSVCFYADEGRGSRVRNGMCINRFSSKQENCLLKKHHDNQESFHIYLFHKSGTAPWPRAFFGCTLNGIISPE